MEQNLNTLKTSEILAKLEEYKGDRKLLLIVYKTICVINDLQHYYLSYYYSSTTKYIDQVTEALFFQFIEQAQEHLGISQEGANYLGRLLQQLSVRNELEEGYGNMVDKYEERRR